MTNHIRILRKKWPLLFCCFFFLCALCPPENAFSETKKRTDPIKNKKLSERSKRAVSRFKQPIKELKKVTDPVENAVTKTAQTAVKEAQSVAKEAHTVGGKFLQGIINIMIAASPGKTRVYLPAPSSDPNSGVTVGMLPVFMFVDDKEEIRHIMAPSITYNGTFGLNSTMRYYWYPHRGAQLFSIGSYAIETNRRFTFRYEDPAFLNREWFYVRFELTTLRDGSYRFFGLGPKSDFQNQSNYTLRDNFVQMHAGVNFLEKFRLAISHRFRYANVVDGPIESLPKISDYSPRPEGVLGSQKIIAQRFSLSYDSRDLPMAPVSGHFFSFFSEVAGYLGGDVRYERLGGELKGFYPLRENRFVSGWHFLFEGENGERTPIYEQSILGGKDSLRGFGDARFIDRNKASFSFEERMRIYTLQAFNVNVEFEIAPFYEAGSVFNKVGSFKMSDLHHTGGVGFRSIVRPNVVGVIELGFGEEGTALFVGIDYPF